MKEVSRKKECEYTWEQLAVWEAVRSSVSMPPRVESFVERYGHGRFEDCCERVIDYISSSRALLRRPRVEELLRLIFKCLAREMRSQGIPTTPKTLLDNIGQVPYAVDQRFPGYAEAGRLHLLV